METPEGQEDYNKIKWQVDRLYFSQIINEEDNIKEIIKLHREHPNHSDINTCLARLYESYDDFDKAANFFNIAALNSQDAKGRFNNFCSAAISWANHGDIKEMTTSLNGAKDLKGTIDDGESHLLKVMADIYKLLNDNENYIALLEGFIDEKPYEHDIRFNLAFKYSEIDEHDLSLYHYKILIEQRPDQSVWNNIGWARESLKLPGKAINLSRIRKIRRNISNE